MSARFRHEDVASVPSGWKVRTVTHGKHRVRVAFPPGRRQKGSGRLVSVLHPIGENPCELRSTNPAELMVMSANNPPRGRNVSYAVHVETWYGPDKAPEAMQTYIRQAATRDEASKIKKEEKQKARDRGRKFKITIQRGRKNPSELLVMAANPRVEVVHGENPPVEEITEEFSGTEVKWLDVYNEPHIPRGRYAYLAKLFRLIIKPAKGGQVQKITFAQDGENAPLIVSDASAKQLYFVDGGQDISSCLRSPGSIHADSVFGEKERGDGIVELGQAREIHYIGKKHHIGDEDTDEWRHTHGEENGVLPTVLFDTRNKRLLYEGGDYRIEGPWIHN